MRKFLLSIFVATAFLFPNYAGKIASASDTWMFIENNAFTPLSLPNLKVWLDFNDTSKMNSGSAADADPIQTITDKSTNAFVFTGTVNQRPLYKANIKNGKGVARWDGVNDFLTSNLTTDLTTFTFYATVYAAVNRQFNTLFSSNVFDSTMITFENGASNSLDCYINGSKGGTGSGSFSVTAWHKIFLTYTSGDGKIYIDGSNVGTFNTTGARLEATNFVVGFDQTGAGFFDWNGDMMDVILTSDVISAGNMTSVTAWAAAKAAF